MVQLSESRRATFVIGQTGASFFFIVHVTIANIYLLYNVKHMGVYYRKLIPHI